MLADVTNAPASAGTTKEPKVYRGRTRAPWYNKSLTKEMYFKLEAYDEMEEQLRASNEMCKQAEATNRQLMLDTRLSSVSASRGLSPSWHRSASTANKSAAKMRT